MAEIIRFEVIKPEGRLTAASARSLREAMEHLMTAGVKAILIDLGNVNFVDSFGLGILLMMRSSLKKQGGMLYLCGAQVQMRCLMEFADITQLFPLFNSESEFVEEVIRKPQLSVGMTAD
jgi:anti-sigma B factor antagonist